MCIEGMIRLLILWFALSISLPEHGPQPLEKGPHSHCMGPLCEGGLWDSEGSIARVYLHIQKDFFSPLIVLKFLINLVNTPLVWFN